MAGTSSGADPLWASAHWRASVRGAEQGKIAYCAKLLAIALAALWDEPKSVTVMQEQKGRSPSARCTGTIVIAAVTSEMLAEGRLQPKRPADVENSCFSGLATRANRSGKQRLNRQPRSFSRSTRRRSEALGFLTDSDRSRRKRFSASSYSRTWKRPQLRGRVENWKALPGNLEESSNCTVEGITGPTGPLSLWMAWPSPPCGSQVCYPP